MAPPLARAAIELDYPLYALDFCGEDAARLVVGGGGGAGRSGVGNKMTVLEVLEQTEQQRQQTTQTEQKQQKQSQSQQTQTQTQTLRVAGEIELSRDEDSVMCLAVGPPPPPPQGGKPPPTTTTTTRLFAGVNSSPADVARGVNEHLRALAVVQRPAGKASSGSGGGGGVGVVELSRTALFAKPDADAYQRLLRVAGGVGAAASAMGREPQIAVFDAAGERPAPRGLLELPADAEDLDVVQTAEWEFRLAFCYRYEVHVVAIGKPPPQQKQQQKQQKQPQKSQQQKQQPQQQQQQQQHHHHGEPRLVFVMPDDHGRRPALRSIRFLTPDFLLAVANLPQRRGVLIQAFRLPAAGRDDMASIAATARIPRNMAATALAVANPSPPSPAWSAAGDAQFVVAVAGSDSSISLYTLEHRASPSSALKLLSDLYPVCTVTDAHGGGSITGLAFSRPTAAAAAGPRAVRLASVSLQKTVAVHDVPLREVVVGGGGAEQQQQQRRRRKGPPRQTRLVVAMRAQRPSWRPLVVALSLIVLVMAMAGRAVMEAHGRSEPVLLTGRLFSSWHGTLASAELRPPSVPSQALNELLARLAGGRGTPPPAAGQSMVLLEEEGGGAGIRAAVHDAAAHGAARAWDELGAEQRRRWRERLREAGAWTQDMGESVFRGILFGEIAGAIGRAMEG